MLSALLVLAPKRKLAARRATPPEEAGKPARPRFGGYGVMVTVPLKFPAPSVGTIPEVQDPWPSLIEN